MAELKLCPLPSKYTCEEVVSLRKRIAELEMQVVRMEAYDDNITESRVFKIEFCKLLNLDEAMDIFARNVKRIFGRSEDGN